MQGRELPCSQNYIPQLAMILKKKKKDEKDKISFEQCEPQNLHWRLQPFELEQ